MRPIRLQSSQQNRPYKTINTGKLLHCNTNHFVLVLQCCLKRGKFHFPLLSPLDCVDLLYANATYPFYKNKMGKRSFFLSYKKKKKRDDFLLPKSSLFFLKPWMNKQKISRILFVHPLKICEQYGFIQSCSYKSKASNRPRTIQQKK